MFVGSAEEKRSRGLPRRFLIITMCQTQIISQIIFFHCFWGCALDSSSPPNQCTHTSILPSPLWHESSSHHLCWEASTPWDVLGTLPGGSSPALLFVAGKGVLIKTYGLFTIHIWHLDLYLVELCINSQAPTHQGVPSLFQKLESCHRRGKKKKRPILNGNSKFCHLGWDANPSQNSCWTA